MRPCTTKINGKTNQIEVVKNNIVMEGCSSESIVISDGTGLCHWLKQELRAENMASQQIFTIFIMYLDKNAK